MFSGLKLNFKSVFFRAGEKIYGAQGKLSVQDSIWNQFSDKF
jgi:hypothetical protein